MTTLVDVARAEEVWDAGRDAGTVGALAEQATAVMKGTLEGRPAGG